MEADERAAADRNPRRGAGHHVVVAGAVVALVVADRADDRRTCRRSPASRCHVLREVHAGDLAWRSARTRRESRPARRAWDRTFRSASGRRPARSGCSSSAFAAAAAPVGRLAARAAAGRPSPPPASAPRPSLQAVAASHAFAVVDGIDSWQSARSVLEHELGRVQQRPHQIFGRLRGGSASGREQLDGRLRVPRRSASGSRRAGTALRRSARGGLSLAASCAGAAVVAGHLACAGRARSSGAAPAPPSCRGVRSQGGSWFGSGRPKVSRNSESTRCVQISHRPRAGRHGRRTSRARR